MKQLHVFVLTVLAVCLAGCNTLGSIGRLISPTKKATESTYVEVNFSDLEGRISRTKTPGTVFVTEAPFLQEVGGTVFFGTQSSRWRLALNMHDSWRETSTEFPSYSSFVVRDSWQGALVPKQVYKIYVGVYFTPGSEHPQAYLDRVEGVLSAEEVAQQHAADEEKRRALALAEEVKLAEANSYSEADFAYHISGFKPATYVESDLFAADQEAGRIPRGDGTVDLFGRSKRQMKSVLKFVGQDGTDIVFSSADRAISQYFKIAGRSQLKQGQTALVYFTVSKNPLLVWTVDAIGYTTVEATANR